MCGVVGTIALGNLEDKEQEKIRQEIMIYLTTEILTRTVKRGKEATGVATMFSDGEWMGLKMGISSPDFVTRWGGKSTDYDGYLTAWRKYKKPARICIGHCRKPSTGGGAPAYENENNHPIRVGDTVIIHNGTLKNDVKIHRLLDVTPDGKVDSEAIAHLLHRFSEDGKIPWSTEMLKQVCNRLEGQYCVLAFNGNNPLQMPVFRDGRPLEMCLIKPLNLIVLASEQEFIKDVLINMAKLGHMYNMGWPVLKKGDLDFLKMPEDSVIVFDLRHTVGERRVFKKLAKATNIRIEDFYSTEKTVRAHKVWNVDQGNKTTVTQPTTTTTSTKTTTTITPAAAAAQAKSVEVSASVVKDNSKEKSATKKNEKPTGRIYCRALEEYVPTTDLDTSELKSVGIDKDTGKVVNLTDKAVIINGEEKSDPTTDPDTLSQSDKPTDLIEDKAKITTKIVDGSPGEEKSEVDIEVDTEAVEKAAAAVECMSKYENSEEVSNDLRATVPTLKALPLHALANKLKKLFFEAGYKDGYTDANKNKSSQQNPRDVKNNPKAIAQRKNIRILKLVVEMILSLAGKKNIEEPTEEEIKETFLSKKKGGVLLTGTALGNVFTPGDRNRSKFLDRLVNVAEEADKD